MFFYTFIPKLLNMSLTASVVIVIVLLLRVLLKKAPKVISYALWGIVLFRLLCPVTIESGLSLFGLFDTPVKESGAITSSIEYIPQNIVHTEYPSVVLPVPGVNELINNALPEGREQLVCDPLEAPMAIATYIWMLGVLVMVIYAGISYAKLRRKLITASPFRDNIYLADEITSPFVMGLFVPKIYLPSSLSEREQEYIIQHEQHHINRLDHIMKALAFVALCIHWFNPLVWVAFIMAGKDMEMSCDEAVVKKMGDGVLADYAASLLSLATGRHIIAGMPLAFGEGDTKERIRNLANWKKPTFWVVLIAVIVCVILAVCLLTNPAGPREFSGWGGNVSDIEPQRIVEQIVETDRLGDIPIHTNANNFDIRLTSDFDMDDTQVISFFYEKGQKTFSSQLAFDNDGTFRITTPSEWPEQTRVYMLQSYLEALKYLPKEDIHALSPNAGRYLLVLRDGGAPADYGRSITYTPEGAGPIDGWIIHIEIQPMYPVDETAYHGTGDEIIHVFYSGGKRDTEQTHGVVEATDEIDFANMISGATYVPYQCIYMNPLSSYMAFGGDSGYKYIVDENTFTTVNRTGGVIHDKISHPYIDTLDSLAISDEINIEKWEWQGFPYTDEEWNALFIPEMSAVKNISILYDEILYQSLTENMFLLSVDGDLWLVELKNNKEMGTYIWSIYSLIKESVMGSARWEHNPYLSSLTPVFQFGFDMEYIEVSAVCEGGSLVEFNYGDKKSGSELTVPSGQPLSWSPLGKDILNQNTKISFTIHTKDGIPRNGVLYIEQESNLEEGGFYTASLVGTGLHLSPDKEGDGGVISLVENTETMTTDK